MFGPGGTFTQSMVAIESVQFVNHLSHLPCKPQHTHSRAHCKQFGAPSSRRCTSWPTRQKTPSSLQPLVHHGRQCTCRSGSLTRTTFCSATSTQPAELRFATATRTGLAYRIGLGHNSARVQGLQRRRGLAQWHCAACICELGPRNVDTRSS